MSTKSVKAHNSIIASGAAKKKFVQVGVLLFVVLALVVFLLLLDNRQTPALLKKLDQSLFNQETTGQVLAEEPPPDECTSGVADGDVTIDGRPLLWKLRNEIDVTNDLHYFVSGVEHYPGLGPALYSYLGMGPANDSPEGPVRQGLNSQGLAVGWNVLGSSGWLLLHNKALGYYNTINQVRAFLNQMTDLSTFNFFIDIEGEASLWESQTGLNQHWEYNTRAPARDSQWIDVDNADGDDNYATGTDVTLSGWVVRANDPGHFNADGTDNLGNIDRYKVGRDVTGSLIYNNGYGTALSAKNLAMSFFRNNALAINDTVSNMIVQGVLPTEDPRLSTMWVLLGHSETGIFVPVWIHGVESGEMNNVPQYLDNDDDGISVYALARGMYNAGFNQINLQARTLPFEEHLFDVVNNTLLPDWRSRDWTDEAVVTIIGEEMKRVQEQMDADAFWHLKYLSDHGSTSNHAPRVSIDSVSYNELEATFSITTYDADDDSLTYLFNFGDGQISSDETHQYVQDGHYLVSCTVTDNHGVSQTEWLFITIFTNGNFSKAAPTNAAIGISLTPTLMWGASSGTTSYEYCYDTSNDNACSNWTSNGTNTSVALSGLSLNTTYYWQVRATNSSDTIYANGAATSFWRFTTGNLPGAFAKTAPVNAATGISLTPTLSWGTSSRATSYYYCYDTSNNNACSSWTSNGANTSVALSGLSLNTTYYWHVRAANSFGTTYANGAASTFWSFTTGNVPGTFAKTAPANAATGISLAPTLTWGASSGATSYEYCYDTSNNNACSSWTSNGTNTSVTLSGLSLNTTFYWHVRAINSFGTTYANGAASTFWSFTTGNVPGAFAKTAPANASTGISLNPMLAWGTSSGATSYEYCYDTSNDNACSSWTSNGASTSVSLSGLSLNTANYWHVRATNSFGITYADGSATPFWSFTTGDLPGAFAKTAPANAATGISLAPTLTWGASIGTTSYEYCYDTSNDNACSSWAGNGTNTSFDLSGLSLNTTYYWHVRATNSFGTIYANGAASTFWSFTTGNVPGAFAKTAPANDATWISLTPMLTWGASIGTTSYEYCYDTTNDNACSSWTSNGTNTHVALSGLSLNTTYYWQARAINVFGTSEADGETWWNFTTSKTHRIFLPVVAK